MKKLFLAIVAIAIFAVAYYGLSPLWRTSSLDEAAPVASIPSEETKAEGVLASETPIVEPMPEVAEPTSKVATIVDTPLHPAEGRVRLVATADGTVVRYEEFKTINGPDLFVYLSNDLEARDFVDLGPLRATEGNINYAVPSTVDPSKYRYALVWCKQFGVLFNSADLAMAR